MVSTKLAVISMALVLGIPVTWFAYSRVSLHYKFAKWNPEMAVADAQRDLQQGRPRVYLNGTIASQRVGVEPEDFSLVSDLPTEDAGIGCIVDNWDLRKMQREYATRYNREIVKYQRQHKPRV